MREAQHGLRARRGEGIEARRFHLDRKNPGLGRRLDRRMRFAERRIRRPAGPNLDGNNCFGENVPHQAHESWTASL
jgi:hypothetical protein